MKYGNCILSAAYLLVRFREVDHVLVLKGASWPLHLMVCRKRCYWHFDWLPPPMPKRGFHPWYFEGRLTAVRRHLLAEETKRRKRRIIALLSAGQTLAVLLPLFAFLALPWFLAWACYGIGDVMFWTRSALQRRFNNGRNHQDDRDKDGRHAVHVRYCRL